jgi:hypothetical protein
MTTTVDRRARTTTLGATITNLFVIDENPLLSSVLTVAAAVVLVLRRSEWTHP